MIWFTNDGKVLYICYLLMALIMSIFRSLICSPSWLACVTGGHKLRTFAFKCYKIHTHTQACSLSKHSQTRWHSNTKSPDQVKSCCRFETFTSKRLQLTICARLTQPAISISVFSVCLITSHTVSLPSRKWDKSISKETGKDTWRVCVSVCLYLGGDCQCLDRAVTNIRNINERHSPRHYRTLWL